MQLRRMPAGNDGKYGEGEMMPNTRLAIPGSQDPMVGEDDIAGPTLDTMSRLCIWQHTDPT